MDTVHDAIFANNAIKLNRQDYLTQTYLYQKGLSYNKFKKLNYSLHKESTFLLSKSIRLYYYYYYYYYRYSSLGPVWAETRAQSGDWYGSGTMHPGQVLRGSLPLLSPAFRRSHFRHQVPPRPPQRERS